MATLEVLHQKYPQMINVGYNNHALRGACDWASPNAKDSPGVASFSTNDLTFDDPAKRSFRSINMNCPLPPFAALGDHRSQSFSRKGDAAQAHLAGVDLTNYRSSGGFNNSNLEDADTGAVDDVNMHDIASCNPSEDPAQSVATDIAMSDPEVDALTALLADWHPFHHMVPVVTTHMDVWKPFEPVSRNKRIGSRITHSIRPVKRAKVFHKRQTLSPWSSSLHTLTGRQRRNALRYIKFNSAPITTTATPSTRSLHTPTSSTSSIDTTPSTPLGSSTSTLVEFDTPKQYTFTLLSDNDDIAMGDDSQDMNLVPPEDGDIAMGNILEGIDLHDEEDIIMYYAADDMDIDLAEDTDIILYDASDVMDTD